MTLLFRRRTTPTPRLTRTLGDKLQEIAHRSPADLEALERLADFILDKLNQRTPREAS